MIIAIPTANDKLCMHFGHCEVFTFVKVDRENNTIVELTQKEPPPHEPGILPPWVAQNGSTLVIAGGMGVRAQDLFRQNGVDVITGAPPLGARELVENYLNNTLETGENACDH